MKDNKKANEQLTNELKNSDKKVSKQKIGTSVAEKAMILNINERKEAEDALRESEERYRSVVDNVGIGIATISPAMEILTLNNQMKRWFPHIDVSKRPICYKVFNIPPRETVCSYCPTYKTFQDGQVHESVTETPVGSEFRNYRIISSPIKDRRGNVIEAIEMVDDITEQKRAREALQESEMKYRTIFETTAAATMIVEKDNTICLINNALEKMSGYSKKEIEGKKSWTEFIGHDDLARMQEYHRLRRIDPEAAPRNYEFRFFCKDGRIRDAFLTIAMIPETTMSVASILDITERKQAEAAARENEARLRVLIDNLPFSFWALDNNLCYTMQNAASRSNYGDVIGKKIEDLEISETLKENWLEQYNEALDGRIIREEYRRNKDGEKESYENFVAPVFVDKNITGIVGVSINVTERKKMENDLRESEQRLSDIIDFLPDATFAIDLEGKVIAWNRSIEDMSGIKAEDIIGKGNYEYSVPFYGARRPIMVDMIFRYDDEIKSKYLFVEKDGDVFLAEANVPVKGETRVLWGKASPLYDSKGNVVGAIQSIRDVTDRKRTEKALKKREKELEIKSRNLEELNTALNVLLKQREMDKDELEERTLSNVKHLIIPYIEKLKKISSDAKEEAYIGIIESNLKDIVSPFSQKLSSKYITFTPRELQVANLIKEGRTTKEIAELLNTSPGTIDFHRNNIRNKLNLKNRRANLKSYLLTLG